MADRFKVPIRRWLTWLMLCCVVVAGNASAADSRSSTFRIGLRLTASCQVDSDQLVAEHWRSDAQAAHAIRCSMPRAYTMDLAREGTVVGPAGRRRQRCKPAQPMVGVAAAAVRIVTLTF